MRTCGEARRQAVRERDRQRHQLGRLVGRVAEHHALVAGAGDVELVVGAGRALLVGSVDALGDVGRLAVDRADHRAGVAVEAVGGVVVADVAARFARTSSGMSRCTVGGDLARDDDQAGVHEGLAGDAPVGVLGEHGVQHGVGDLVGDLVGMAFRHRLRREQVLIVALRH